MANSRPSFTKRQKEQSRMEKRREKEARKKQRSLDRKVQTTDDAASTVDFSQPSEGQN
jgi:hypothetical protein